MALLKNSGVGTAIAVLRNVGQGIERPSGIWFGHRFIASATVVVERWGPRWAKRRFGTQAPVGAWILLSLWLGGAVLVVRKLWW
jgi:hypothetical protein